jgi:hypothetical protein
MLSTLANMMQWVAAVFAGIAPRQLWPALEPPLPLRRAAAVSGLVTMVAGFFYGFGGYMIFATRLASANNDWMIAKLSGPPSANDAAAGLLPYGVSVVTLFIYLFLTPRGLLSLYAAGSGLLRAISAAVDDPHGDFVLTGIAWVVTTAFAKNQTERRQISRRRLEGNDAPDILQTGEWAGLADTEYVVLSARRKDEWTAGATILTSTDWYRLGEPFDVQTPAGLRTAYPLKRMDAVEVVRRGIQYELPRLVKVRSTKSKV